MNREHRTAYENATKQPDGLKPKRIADAADLCGETIITTFEINGLCFSNVDPIEVLVTEIFINGCEANDVNWKGLVY